MATYLKDTHPHFKEEWVEGKNKELGFEFDKMTTKANKKAWFLCPLGHEYLALIATRTSYNSGCGYCSNKVILPGFNDLATTNPTLAQEWHPTLNGSLTPSDVFASGKASIWWQCEQGHEWEAKLYSRNSSNAGCKVCKSNPRKIEVDESRLVSEWMDEKNKKPLSSYSHQSNETTWWKCSDCGHEWQARIAERRNGSNCSVCLGLKVASGINDLSTLYPEVYAQINKDLEIGRDLSALPTQAKIVLNWVHPDCGHEWTENIYARTRKKNPSLCSVCKGRKIQSGVNDFFTIHPELKAEWDTETNGDVKMETISASAGTKRHWVCSEGHRWMESPARRHQGSGCPICSGAVIVPGVNDFFTLRPELKSEWDTEANTVDPGTLSKAPDTRVHWVCSVNPDHKWEAVARSRVSYAGRKATGCPHCSNRIVTAGVNDFASVYPELLEEWDFERNTVSPVELAFGSGEKVWWKCLVDSSHPGWEAKLSERSRGQGVCRKCFEFVSINEKRIADWFVARGETVVVSDRSVLKGRELDVLLPERSLAVEYNGVYWHSSVHNRGGDYHVSKFEDSEASGVRLVQVWEDEFRASGFDRVTGFLGLCLSDTFGDPVVDFEDWDTVSEWVLGHSFWVPVGADKFDWLTVRDSGGVLQGVVGVNVGNAVEASVELVLLPGCDSHGWAVTLTGALVERYGMVSGRVRNDFGVDILFGSGLWVRENIEVDSYVFTVGDTGRIGSNLTAERLFSAQAVGSESHGVLNEILLTEGGETVSELELVETGTQVSVDASGVSVFHLVDMKSV